MRIEKLVFLAVTISAMQSILFLCFFFTFIDFGKFPLHEGLDEFRGKSLYVTLREIEMVLSLKLWSLRALIVSFHCCFNEEQQQHTCKVIINQL